MKKNILIVILFISAFLLVFLFGNNHDFIKTGKLYINEIVSSNKQVIMDDDGEYSDYIELYNGYSDMSLEGFMLSDSEFETRKWTFPNITIKKGEYLIVYASGKDKCDLEKRICHTNFKLQKDGEVLTLTDSSNNIISKVSYPKLSNDSSYSYYGGKYIITSSTPNKENVKNVSVDIKNIDLQITEYMTHNKNSVRASNGGYYDFIELYNNGKKDINLEGLSLSDNSKNLNKFILPNYILKSKEYVVIYLTGGEKIEGSIAANFKLSDDDEKIIISYNDKVLKEIEILDLVDNLSYGIKEDKWCYFSSPTPGRENNTSCSTSLGGNSDSS